MDLKHIEPLATIQDQLEGLTGQLHDSEERYRLLVENVKDYAILMLDPQGRVATWTTAAERIKGYTAAQIVGKSFECFYTAEDIAHGHPAEVLRAARLAGHFEEEGWRVRKDGSKFWASVMITAVYCQAGELRGFSKLTRDIGERRKAEEAMAAREEQFRVLLDCAPEAIVIIDENGNLVLINEQAGKLFGYPRPELLGQSIQKLIPQGGIQNFAGGELKGLRKNGEPFPVKARIRPVQIGQREWLAVGIQDITEFRKVEERLIAERKRAEVANGAKSDFLAAMSHEIRTPMNVILGMSDLLYESDLNAEQKEHVSLFRRAGSTLLTLIDELLDLSKIEDGHFELECVEFDLEEVVDQAVELIRAKARLKDLALMSRISPGTALSLVGDPNRLRQVLINLLGNAVKFTESGHVLVTIENAASGRPGEIGIAVSDTGIGIAPDKLGTIFAAFAQADATITRKYGGTGLGLAISRRLVQRMGGELAVASTPGKGSTFSFTAQCGIAGSKVKRFEGALDDIHGRRVMIVDNNPVNGLILREALAGWGCMARTFELPDDALADISGLPQDGPGYSLIIVDKKIPGMNGFKLSRKIRELTPSTPIVMLSSEAAPGDVTKSARLGLAGYAVKPIRRTDLFRLVCKAMNVASHREVQPSPNAAVPAGKEPASRALKILVAEDSPDNRLLIQAYMKGSPHAITFADDGLAAVSEFTKTQFDLILMDLRMPTMDGLTAARKIRDLEAHGGTAPVPIVALSANARREDIELTRKSGFNTHLSKPISKPRLLATIEEYACKHVPGENGTIQAAGGSPEDREQPTRIDLPPGLDQIRPGYLANRREEFPEIMALLAASDFERLADLGHNMKGSGSSYGFPDISRIGAALEEHANESDRQALRASLIELGTYLDRVQPPSPEADPA